MKICVTCHVGKQLQEFNLRGTSPDGRQARCRDCCKAWYQLNRERHVAQVGRRSRRMRDEYRGRVVAYLLEHPCIDCSESDVRVLEFDHRPGLPKVNCIAHLVNELVAWTSILAEIAKCDVRCANCHRRKTAERGQQWRHRWHVEQQGKFDPAARLARIFRAA